VDNTRHEDGVPTLETDWWNYGGITRSVSLIEVPEAFIDQYDVHLFPSRERKLARQGNDLGAVGLSHLAHIHGWIHVDGGHVGDKVEIQIPELKSTGSGVLGADGRAQVLLVASEIERWSPETPKLYNVILRAGEDSIEEKIGFRTIETSGTQILLNGKPVFLRGISIHAEAPYRTGRANTDKDAETLLGWAKEMGCNFVRLAHYPHDETMLRAADRMGLMVWSENPVYWALQFDNPKVLAKAEQQLDEEIGTSRNHASIILWSMANETPNTEARTRFLETEAAHARELDPTRLITAALLVRGEGHKKIVDDPLGKTLDVMSGTIGTAKGSENAGVIDVWNLKAQHGLSDMNIRHQVTFNGVWTIPSPKFSNAFLTTAAKGWVFSGMGVLHSGVPATVFTTSETHDFNLDGNGYDLPNVPSFGRKRSASRSQYLHGTVFPGAAGAQQKADFPLPVDGNGQPTGVEGNLGRNTYTAPGFAEIDSTLSKDTRIPWFRHNAAMLRITLNAYNLFNRVNISNWDTDLDDLNFGLAQGALQPRTLELGAKITF